MINVINIIGRNKEISLALLAVMGNNPLLDMPSKGGANLAYEGLAVAEIMRTSWPLPTIPIPTAHAKGLLQGHGARRSPKAGRSLARRFSRRRLGTTGTWHRSRSPSWISRRSLGDSAPVLATMTASNLAQAGWISCSTWPMGDFEGVPAGAGDTGLAVAGGDAWRGLGRA